MCSEFKFNSYMSENPQGQIPFVILAFKCCLLLKEMLLQNPTLKVAIMMT